MPSGRYARTIPSVSAPTRQRLCEVSGLSNRFAFNCGQIIFFRAVESVRQRFHCVIPVSHTGSLPSMRAQSSFRHPCRYLQSLSGHHHHHHDRTQSKQDVPLLRSDDHNDRCASAKRLSALHVTTLSEVCGPIHRQPRLVLLACESLCIATDICFRQSSGHPRNLPDSAGCSASARSSSCRCREWKYQLKLVLTIGV